MSLTTLMGPSSNIKVGAVAHGIMLMTWVPKAIPDEQAFEAFKAGIDALPSDTKMLINSGEFYGPTLGTDSLELLSRFFEKYPSYADRVFLSVKGGLKAGVMIPDGSPENLKRSIDACKAALRGTKRIDLFECARVAQNASLESVLETLKGFVAQGDFDYIGMSECSAETLRKAVSIAPILSVEIEVSLWSYEEETKKVIATAKELGLSVHAYSPIGCGMLTGQIKKASDIPEGDIRHSISRFSPENFDENLKLVAALETFAEKRGVTAAQLAIAWVRSLGEHIIPLAGSSKKERTLENLKAAEIVLSAEELASIDEILQKFAVKGGRAIDGVDPKVLHLWG
ncbi:aldo/keto reductase [Flagelloscypha sp. PMI_526]|nr:aldo/keto reductase [Flagelloscypha sp. PMI_526]